MQTVSSTYKRLFRQQHHITEVRATIGDSDYGMDRIYNAKHRLNLFSGSVPEIGNCCAATLELGIIPDGMGQRMAEITLATQLVSPDGTERSEWLPAGTFYADSKSKSDDGEHLQLSAFDAMMKADQPYLENSQISTWPAEDENDVVADIASLMGVVVDSRTVLAGYSVPLPDQDWTAREVLGWIGAANGGNWIITPANELLLVKLEGITSLLGPDRTKALLLGDSLIVLSTTIKYEDTRDLLGKDDTAAIKFGNDFVVMNGRTQDGYYGYNDGQDISKNARNLQNLGMLPPFSGVKLWYSRETTYEDIEVEHGGETTTEKVEVENAYMAGDDSGRVLEADCPWATQEMADAILQQIEGFCWQGAVVEGAEITPAAELGDTVICNGVAFPLASMDITYNGSYAPTISSPADEEVDEEYPYETETERKLNRKVSIGENYYGFKVTRESGIEVSNIVDGVATTRMILNSNEQKFFDADGNLALYFDPVAGKYKFRGDVIIGPGYHLQSSAVAIFPLEATEEQMDAEAVPEGLNIYGLSDNQLFNFLRIYQLNEYTHFASPDGGYAMWDFGRTDYMNIVGFYGTTKYFGPKTNDDEVATVGYVKSLTVHPIIITQPQDITATAGSSATASIVAARATGYQWYYRAAGATTWNASTAASGKTANYTFTANASYNGRQIYCEVKNQYGSTYSDVITLTVV